MKTNLGRKFIQDIFLVIQQLMTYITIDISCVHTFRIVVSPIALYFFPKHAPGLVMLHENSTCSFGVDVNRK